MYANCSYDRFPTIAVEGEYTCAAGWKNVTLQLEKALAELVCGRKILALECYPGVDKAGLMWLAQQLHPMLAIDTDRCFLSGEALDVKMADNLTDDRVFGVMTTHTLEQYLVQEQVERVGRQIEQTADGLVVLVGVGAGLVAASDLLVYCDIARWELQLRYRSGQSNWNTNNGNAPILEKYKRGYFVEWRLADRRKKAVFQQIHFYMDANCKEEPKLLTGEGWREGLRQVSQRPFRVQPYFDPGVWGGQWMKQVCNLDPEQTNYAWSFDGVPEENSLLLRYGDCVVEQPAVNLVFMYPKALLGGRVYARFGAEFPIRFDFLDTMEGQNLSLQVHPLTAYIQQQFNMRYTQDESYYILDAAAEDTYVYLGVKNQVNREAMVTDLYRAQRGEIEFPADTYINKIPVKKHDHLAIPAGTIHCSGKNTMVLEISATPYIFTFKLWDWARLGLDGLPRPIHLEHGVKNIEWERDTDWVYEQLMNQTCTLEKREGWVIERTGLHPTQFIETLRYTFSGLVQIDTMDGVHMLNLVEGQEILIESPTNTFAPYVVHYAETFILPASVGSYTMRAHGDAVGQEVMVICASIRG